MYRQNRSLAPTKDLLSRAWIDACRTPPAGGE